MFEHLQETEQVQAALRDVAKFVWDYHERLLRVGFNSEQAFTLALAFQDSLIRGGLQNGSK